MFTDYYAENSCTAGRSTFITGQSPLRTGLSKVGLPGVAMGMSQLDILRSGLLKVSVTLPANSEESSRGQE